MNNSSRMRTGGELLATDIVDWRTQLQPDFRSRIVINMLDSSKKYLKFGTRKVLMSLEKRVDRIEEEAYNGARSEWSYLLEISHKMLLTEAGLQKLPNYVVNSNRTLDEDWRTQLQPYSWKRIFSKMMDTCRKYLPFSCQLENIFKEYEENLYIAARSQWDYLWQISQMMSNIESKFQNTMPNQVGHSNQPSDPGSLGMKTQTQQLPQNIQNPFGVESSSSLSSGTPPTSSNLAQSFIQNPSMQIILAGLQNSVDWRRPSYREQIFDMMIDICKKHISYSVPNGLYYLEYFVNDFEEKVYQRARSQWHYLCYVTQTMGLIEIKHPNIIQRSLLEAVGLNPSMQCVPAISENPKFPNSPSQMVESQQHHGSTSLDSTAQIGHANGDYLQEVEYQKIKSMEDEVSETNQEIITKLQQLCVADAFDGMSYD